MPSARAALAAVLGRAVASRLPSAAEGRSCVFRSAPRRRAKRRPRRGREAAARGRRARRADRERRTGPRGAGPCWYGPSAPRSASCCPRASRADTEPRKSARGCMSATAGLLSFLTCRWPSAVAQGGQHSAICLAEALPSTFFHLRAERRSALLLSEPPPPSAKSADHRTTPRNQLY